MFSCMDAARMFSPSTAGAVYIRFFHFLLANYISAFKHVKDKE